MNPELTLLHVHGESIGYGRLGVKLTEALQARGVDVYDHLEPPESVSKMNSVDLKVAAGRRHKRTNVVGWVSVPTHARGWYRGQFTFLFTMWEADQLPESFRQTLHNHDLVIVPSRQNQELFSRWHPNVAYAPLGIDPADWSYVPRSEPGMFFDVLVGGSGGRKGVDLAVEAFAKAFPEGSWGDGPIPRLVLKSPKDNFGLEPAVRAELPWPPPERMMAVHGRLSAADEQALYASSHVYLQPSRGEGFGLQPLQAIAQGLPTILTDAHGHEAFSHLGWPVSAEMEQAGYFIFGGEELGMRWWRPSVDDCVDALRAIYDDYEGACSVAARAAVEAREFTWDRCAGDVVEAIGMGNLCTQHRLAPVNPLLARLPVIGSRHVENRRWVAPEQKLYRVIVNEDWQADIGGSKRYYERGRLYWETADVKRILFEAGRLDPSCYSKAIAEGQQGEDDGLLASQRRRVNDASSAYCPHCRQRLNSKPALEDDLLRLLDQRAPLR